MPLPASFAKEGFLAPDKLRNGRKRRLMIGSRGQDNTGKTEFILSAPGPIMVECLDRGHEAMLDNPNPPASRRDDFAIRPIKLPLATQAEDFRAAWTEYRDNLYRALTNPDARTVAVDTQSDAWELQRLAAFGKLTQVPPILYAEVNAAHRAMLARMFDSGKNIICTHKIDEEYETQLSDKGKEVRIKTGNWKIKGFHETNYLYQMQILHLVDKKKGFGIEILKCKHDTGLVGMQLWGDECNFTGLVQLTYPEVPLAEWGL